MSYSIKGKRITLTRGDTFPCAVSILNPDGTPYVAWLMVRMDFLLWVTAELKKEGKGDGAR